MNINGGEAVSYGMGLEGQVKPEQVGQPGVVAMNRNTNTEACKMGTSALYLPQNSGFTSDLMQQCYENDVESQTIQVPASTTRGSELFRLKSGAWSRASLKYAAQAHTHYVGDTVYSIRVSGNQLYTGLITVAYVPETNDDIYTVADLQRFTYQNLAVNVSKTYTFVNHDVTQTDFYRNIVDGVGQGKGMIIGLVHTPVQPASDSTSASIFIHITERFASPADQAIGASPMRLFYPKSDVALGAYIGSGGTSATIETLLSPFRFVRDNVPTIYVDSDSYFTHLGMGRTTSSLFDFTANKNIIHLPPYYKVDTANPGNLTGSRMVTSGQRVINLSENQSIGTGCFPYFNNNVYDAGSGDTLGHLKRYMAMPLFCDQNFGDSFSISTSLDSLQNLLISRFNSDFSYSAITNFVATLTTKIHIPIPDYTVTGTGQTSGTNYTIYNTGYSNQSTDNNPTVATTYDLGPRRFSIYDHGWKNTLFENGGVDGDVNWILSEEKTSGRSESEIKFDVTVVALAVGAQRTGGNNIFAVIDFDSIKMQSLRTVNYKLDGTEFYNESALVYTEDLTFQFIDQIGKPIINTYPEAVWITENTLSPVYNIEELPRYYNSTIDITGLDLAAGNCVSGTLSSNVYTHPQGLSQLRFIPPGNTATSITNAIASTNAITIPNSVDEVVFHKYFYSVFGDGRYLLKFGSSPSIILMEAIWDGEKKGLFVNAPYYSQITLNESALKLISSEIISEASIPNPVTATATRIITSSTNSVDYANLDELVKTQYTTTRYDNNRTLRTKQGLKLRPGYARSTHHPVHVNAIPESVVAGSAMMGLGFGMSNLSHRRFYEKIISGGRDWKYDMMISQQDFEKEILERNLRFQEEMTRMRFVAKGLTTPSQLRTNIDQTQDPGYATSTNNDNVAKGLSTNGASSTMPPPPSDYRTDTERPDSLLHDMDSNFIGQGKKMTPTPGRTSIQTSDSVTDPVMPTGTTTSSTQVEKLSTAAQTPSSDIRNYHNETPVDQPRKKFKPNTSPKAVTYDDIFMPTLTKEDYHRPSILKDKEAKTPASTNTIGTSTDYETASLPGYDQVANRNPSISSMDKGAPFSRSPSINSHSSSRSQSNSITSQTIGAPFSRSPSINSHSSTKYNPPSITSKTSGAPFSRSPSINSHSSYGSTSSIGDSRFNVSDDSASEVSTEVASIITDRAPSLRDHNFGVPNHEMPDFDNDASSIASSTSSSSRAPSMRSHTFGVVNDGYTDFDTDYDNDSLSRQPSMRSHTFGVGNEYNDYLNV